MTLSASRILSLLVMAAAYLRAWGIPGRHAHAGYCRGGVRVDFLTSICLAVFFAPHHSNK